MTRKTLKGFYMTLRGNWAFKGKVSEDDVQICDYEGWQPSQVNIAQNRFELILCLAGIYYCLLH